MSMNGTKTCQCRAALWLEAASTVERQHAGSGAALACALLDVLCCTSVKWGLTRHSCKTGCK